MTEQTHVQGGTAVAEPPAPFLPADADDSGDGANRRNLLIVGAIVGALVLGLVAFFLLKGGGNSNPAPSGAVVHQVLPPAKAPAAKGPKPLKLPKVYKGHIGRDPFKALYVAPAAAPGAAT